MKTMDKLTEEQLQEIIKDLMIKDDIISQYDKMTEKNKKIFHEEMKKLNERNS